MRPLKPLVRRELSPLRVVEIVDATNAGTIRTYIQGTAPVVAAGVKYLWVDVSVDPPTLWVEDGV